MSTLSTATPTNVPGLGTTLSLGGVGVLGRAEIEGPDMSMGGADVTSLDSPVVTMRPTLLDPGKVSLKLWYDPNSASHQAITTAFVGKQIGAWVLTFADGHTTSSNIAFPGYISAFKAGGMDPSGYLTADVEIQVTGLPVFNAGTQ